MAKKVPGKKKQAKRSGTSYTSAAGLEGWSRFASTSSALGRHVTENEALNVSTVFACFRVLTDNVCTLPAILYEKLEGGGKNRANLHPYYPLLKFKPNVRDIAVDFYSHIMISLLRRGNAFIQKVLNVNFEVVQLVVLYPDYVRVKEGNRGEILYEYFSKVSGEKRTFTQQTIIHIKNMSMGGLVGLSPLDCALQTSIGSAIAAEEHGGKFFANGVNPSGVLEHPGQIGEEALGVLKKQFQDNYSGSANTGQTIILEEGMKWNQMSLTNEQSQFLETRKFNVTDICRWFGVPPHKVGDLERATFSNIEHQAKEFVDNCLRPYLVRIEQSILMGLFEEKDWDKYSFEFMTDALLRGDTLTRHQSYQLAIQNGILSPDEARSMENRNPIPEKAGAKFWQPANMQILGATPTAEPGSAVEKPPASNPNGAPPNAPAPVRSFDTAAEQWLDITINRITKRRAKMMERGKALDNEVFEREAMKELEPVFRELLKTYSKGNENDVRTKELARCTIEQIALLKTETEPGETWGSWALKNINNGV